MNPQGPQQAPTTRADQVRQIVTLTAEQEASAVHGRARIDAAVVDLTTKLEAQHAAAAVVRERTDELRATQNEYQRRIDALARALRASAPPEIRQFRDEIERPGGLRDQVGNRTRIERRPLGIIDKRTGRPAFAAWGNFEKVGASITALVAAVAEAENLALVVIDSDDAAERLAAIRARFEPVLDQVSTLELVA